MCTLFVVKIKCVDHIENRTLIYNLLINESKLYTILKSCNLPLVSLDRLDFYASITHLTIFYIYCSSIILDPCQSCSIVDIHDKTLFMHTAADVVAYN